MAHNTNSNSIKNSGGHTEGSLSELRRSALHEEQLKNKTEIKMLDIEKWKLFIFFIGIMLGITIFLGFFIIVFIWESHCGRTKWLFQG